jgi:hypothetical protein
MHNLDKLARSKRVFIWNNVQIPKKSNNFHVENNVLCKW